LSELHATACRAPAFTAPENHHIVNCTKIRLSLISYELRNETSLLAPARTQIASADRCPVGARVLFTDGPCVSRSLAAEVVGIASSSLPVAAGGLVSKAISRIWPNGHIDIAVISVGGGGGVQQGDADRHLDAYETVRSHCVKMFFGLWALV
jgi:hypothetical protein